jgi:hypothetical protein
MNNTLFGYMPIASVCYSNYEAIHSIMKLHKIDRFDLDCTYSKGLFWDGIPVPVKKTDLNPQRDGVIKADSSCLPFNDGSIYSLMFDPPFVIAGENYKNDKNGSSLIAKRFEGYKNYNELINHYEGTIKEAFRILIDKGIFVFKCQDTVSGGVNYFTHCMVMNMAVKYEFYPKDLIILIAKNRINSFGNKWKKQEHARKYHSYFWVFQKNGKNTNYTNGKD